MYVTISKSGYYRLSYTLIMNIVDDNDAEDETVELFFSKSSTGTAINRTITKMTFDSALDVGEKYTLSTSAIVHLDTGEYLFKNFKSFLTRC